MNSIVNAASATLVGDGEWRLAEAFVKSGFFKDSRDAAQAIVKIQAGRELGFGPMASMQGVYIVQGKVTLSANLLGAAIKTSGRYNYRVVEHDDSVCTIDFYENGEKIGTSTFTIKDADRAGLMNNPTWKKYARNMLFARALSNGARWHCPDVFGGPLYTPEELGADVDEDGIPTGRSIPATSRPQQEAVDAEVVTHDPDDGAFERMAEATTISALNEAYAERTADSAQILAAYGRHCIRIIAVAAQGSASEGEIDGEANQVGLLDDAERETLNTLVTVLREGPSGSSDESRTESAIGATVAAQDPTALMKILNYSRDHLGELGYMDFLSAWTNCWVDMLEKEVWP